MTFKKVNKCSVLSIEKTPFSVFIQVASVYVSNTFSFDRKGEKMMSREQNY
jgi:hypothetical protein